MSRFEYDRGVRLYVLENLFNGYNTYYYYIHRDFFLSIRASHANSFETDRFQMRGCECVKISTP